MTLAPKTYNLLSVNFLFIAFSLEMCVYNYQL